MTSPCYKCPLHDRLEGTACKLYCGCFKVYEKKSDEIKAKRYKERKAVMDANCVRTDGIRHHHLYEKQAKCYRERTRSDL